MIDIYLFGATTVNAGGTSLVARHLGGSKPRQVLEILALQPGRPVTKEVLAEHLWEDSPPRCYISTLESYVCGLRRKLTELGGVSGVLLTTVGGYVLDPDSVRVDVVEVRDVLDSCDPRLMRHTLRVAGTTLLADDPYATWADRERRRLADDRVRAYVRVAHVANAVGDSEAAVRFSRAAVSEQPWSEPAVQELMTGLAGSGNHAQALVEYQGLRCRMREELGIEPSPATQALYLAALRPDERSGDSDLSVLVSLLKEALETATSQHGPHHPELAEVRRMIRALA